AFRRVEYLEKEEELVILVTPRLVHPISCTCIPKYLPGRETRSPDDYELFLEGILEAPRGQRDVCIGNGMGYHAAHMNGPTAGIYPCNDGSYGHLSGHGGPVSGSCGRGGCGMGGCGAGGCGRGGCGGNGYGNGNGGGYLGCPNNNCAPGTILSA